MQSLTFWMSGTYWLQSRIESGSQAARCFGVHSCAAPDEIANVSARASSAHSALRQALWTRPLPAAGLGSLCDRLRRFRAIRGHVRVQTGSSPFTWEEQGKIDKKPKRQRQQQSEEQAQHDSHSEFR